MENINNSNVKQEEAEVKKTSTEEKVENSTFSQTDTCDKSKAESSKGENKEKESEVSCEQETDSECEKEKEKESHEEEIKDPMVVLQKKYDELNDKYLRKVAEFDNYRKRTLKEKADLIKTGGEGVLVNVLNVVDDMERGINATKDAEDIKAVKEGMELIHSKFSQFLKQNGVKEIETKDKDFDTDLHEAIAIIPAPSEDKKGKILDCIQKGYYLHDKVIRFAKVAVGK